MTSPHVVQVQSDKTGARTNARGDVIRCRACDRPIGVRDPSVGTACVDCGEMGLVHSDCQVEPCFKHDATGGTTLIASRAGQMPLLSAEKI